MPANADLTSFAFPWLAALLALAVAALSMRVLIPLARQADWVDRPSVRKTHEGNIPLIGGWSIALALVVAQVALAPDAIAPWGYWLGALMLFVVAAIDDRHPIRARYRFAVQWTAAIAGVFLGGTAVPDLGNLLGLGPLDAQWLVVPVSVVGMIAVVNAFNFSDGADGLCGGLGFVSLFWLAAALLLQPAGPSESAAHAASLMPLATILMGAITGFLVFNLRTPWRKRALVFLGDSGSTLIGFSVAWLCVHVTSVNGSSGVPPVACLWIVAVPLADAASCFIRRILAGQTPMTADLRHFHHLLCRTRLTVGQAVLVIHLGAFACGMVGVGGAWLAIPEAWLFYGFVAAMVAFIAATNLAWRRIDRQYASMPATA